MAEIGVLGGYIIPVAGALAIDDSSPDPVAPPAPPSAVCSISPDEPVAAALELPPSPLNEEVFCAFGFLGFGQTSPLSLASACLFSNSDLVGLPRFLRGGSTGLIVTGPASGGCCPLGGGYGGLG